jgi:cytochrome c-type biogenesis protein CcmH/NrfG
VSHDERRTKRQRETTARISEIREWLETLASEPGVREDTAWVRSYATALNAHGQAVYLAGDTDAAIAAFQSAIALAPDLADAYVNLGSALYRKRPREWQRRVESALRRGLALAPDNEKAQFLLGRVLADPSVRKLDEARELLGRVRDNPWARFRLAELDADEGKYLAAARHAIESIRISKRVDFRAEKLVEWTLRAGKDGDVDRVVLEAAVASTRSLERAGNDRQRARAEENRARLIALSKQTPKRREPNTSQAAP